MKRYFIIFFSLLVITITEAQQSTNNWKTDVDLGGGFSFTTFLNVEQEQDKFKITSPKNADVRLFGRFKATLGRLLGKSPKKGFFLTINGNQKGDSLIGVASAPMLGKLGFKGIFTENELSGKLTKNDSIAVGALAGVRSNDRGIDYKHFYSKMLKVTENNIYSKDVLQTKEWQKFRKKLEELCNEAQDDIELFLGFSMLSQELPFSHYNLIIQQGQEEDGEVETREPSVIFEEKNGNIAYLNIKNFSTSEAEIAAVFPKIIENKNYKNLIVDLRNNGGGGVEAALEFAKHILKNSVEVGYFLTNKLEYSGFEAKLFENLPVTKSKTTEGLISELKETKGVKLVFQKQEAPIFSGNLYVLTNKKTASTCEPIVYALKKSKRAIIIGEKTAGAMLSAAPFEVSGKYKLFLPLADFYTYDGARLDQVGVEPSIETISEDALEKALSLIKAAE